MKFNINWLRWVVFFFVSAGLLYLTRSFLMSLGIFMLLLIIDWALGEYDKKHSRK